MSWLGDARESARAVGGRFKWFGLVGSVCWILRYPDLPRNVGFVGLAFRDVVGRGEGGGGGRKKEDEGEEGN